MRTEGGKSPPSGRGQEIDDMLCACGIMILLTSSPVGPGRRKLAPLASLSPLNTLITPAPPGMKSGGGWGAEKKRKIEGRKIEERAKEKKDGERGKDGEEGKEGRKIKERSE
jgi:hypothetical protein